MARGHVHTTSILDTWFVGRAEIVAAVAGHLAALPAGAQPPLARQLVPLIAKLPFAAERAGAFAKVLHACKFPVLVAISVLFTTKLPLSPPSAPALSPRCSHTKHGDSCKPQCLPQVPASLKHCRLPGGLLAPDHPTDTLASLIVSSRCQAGRALDMHPFVPAHYDQKQQRAPFWPQVWAAMLALDLQQRRAVRSGAPLLPNADLKALLADPFVMHIAGATCAAFHHGRVAVACARYRG
jgi:hypothetical protein